MTQSRRRTLRVALTGGIATGKSHVRARLATRGAPTIDADDVAHAVIAPGTAEYRAVIATFGPSVIATDGSVDRKVLGRIVFAAPKSRRELETIIHPAVRRVIDQWFAALDDVGGLCGVAVIPLLFETGRERDFDDVVVTTCSERAQLQRLMTRDGLSESDARQRIASQMPQAEKVRRANYVIATDASIEETNRQVDDIWQALTNRCL